VAALVLSAVMLQAALVETEAQEQLQPFLDHLQLTQAVVVVV
jgi:hypothetical protein